MKRVYNYRSTKVSDGSAAISHQIQPVQADEILVVNTIAGHHDNQSTAEGSVFYITNGGVTVYLDTKCPPLANYDVGIQGPIVVPSGWSIGILYPAAANTEVMTLNITGAIYSLDEFRK